MFFDWTYVVYVLPAVIFAMWASAHVNSTYNKYKNQLSARGITGAQAARMVLDANGLYHVRIEQVAGELSDHFDPRTNVVRLSQGVYDNTSTAAIGIACHEVGHAIQHATGYVPVKIRTAIVPITNLGSKLSMPLILIGLVLGAFSEWMFMLVYAGIACFALSTVFQLVTLPTEFNASRRAMDSIQTYNILSDDELRGTRKVLTAAAMTYVAALAVSIMQLLRLLLLAGRRRR
ncbi:MAG: zinc metallopeptidase [Clostridia bacterium]|nr:zinc metallopeptidase [Clostridia bacterium]